MYTHTLTCFIQEITHDSMMCTTTALLSLFPLTAPSTSISSDGMGRTKSPER